MTIAVNDYYKNDVINLKHGQRQKHSAAYVGGQTKNVFPAKEKHFPSIKGFNSFCHNPLNKIRPQVFLKSHFALRCKQIYKRFFYHERNNCQDISSSLLKCSVKKFCCTQKPIQSWCSCISGSGNMIKQLQYWLIQKNTDVVMCAYAVSTINGELAIRRRMNNFSAKDLCSKEVPQIIAPLHVMIGCDVTSRFFVLAKKLWGSESRKVQKLKCFRKSPRMKTSINL